MPRACPVEPHAVSYCSGEREAPRDKPVASRNQAALCSGKRDAPRDKPVASRAVWLHLIFLVLTDFVALISDDRD
jgi:hypothetical protein